ncbi:MAG: molybdenum cofactor guanylyltransferase [Cyclobacteriaceae bacterium]|nr:molybdenum cofactor guanylyltransferase [Cyclobacteriaceae bacterium]
MSEVKSINGLILAGGKSSRMGTDKALIDYHGKPQREYLFDLLSKYCAQVYLSCKEAAHVPPQLNPLPDHYDLNTPLNGILSAFNFNPATAWLTVPVDMPLIDAETIKYLIDHRNPEKIATCFWDSTGKLPEPLLALWETSANNLLSDYYTNSGFSIREFLCHHPVNMVTATTPNWLKNINSFQELNHFRNSLHGKK